MLDAEKKQMELRTFFAMELFSKLAASQQQFIIDLIKFLLSEG